MTLFEQFALEHPKEPYGWQAVFVQVTITLIMEIFKQQKNFLTTIIPYTYKFPLIYIKLNMRSPGIMPTKMMPQMHCNIFLIILGKLRNPISDQTKFYHAKILHAFDKSEEARQILNTLTTEGCKNLA